LSIRIFYDEVNYRLKAWRKMNKTIEKVIRENNRIPGDLSFIITKDETLLKINVEFLGHNYNTDVITFGSNDGITINGEIYISIDTVAKNSLSYNVNLNKEINRVMIHGVLHLLGNDDKTEKQKKKMRKLEDLWLSELGD
jgi:probable rRNA maturation factor